MVLHHRGAIISVGLSVVPVGLDGRVQGVVGGGGVPPHQNAERDPLRDDQDRVERQEDGLVRDQVLVFLRVIKLGRNRDQLLETRLDSLL